MRNIFQELSILQDIGDTRGECKAHGNLGHVHLALGQHTIAGKLIHNSFSIF